MRKYRSAIIGLLVSATVALAFIQLDDTNVQTVLTGAIKTFQDAIHFQATGGGTNYTGLVGPATVPTSVTFKLPSADGTSGQAMVTDGSANLSFASFAGATPTLVPTATPQPTATPPATATPLIDLLYSGKLNLGANASGTPLGLVSITANATPAPHDRIIKCSPPNATPVAYTMPPATGSGRVLDMVNMTGSGNCSMNRAGSDLLNDSTADTLANKWDADTCYDIASAQWACRNLPTPTPTP